MSKEVDELINICKEMRKDVLTMSIYGNEGKAGLHFGGSLSMIEIIAVLLYNVMNYDKNDLLKERDYLIISKGHAIPSLYAGLKEIGILSKDDIMGFKKAGFPLYAHPFYNKKLFIDCSTGSLGQGIGFATGIAKVLKNEKSDKKIYVILGDGELDEGSIYESLMTISKYNLTNIVAIIDKNLSQSDGYTDDVMPLPNLKNRFESFGMNVYSVDGHSVSELIDAFDDIKNKNSDKCNIIIANTIKGKGLSFLENNDKNHRLKLTDEQLEIAKKELEYV